MLQSALCTMRMNISEKETNYLADRSQAEIEKS